MSLISPERRRTNCVHRPRCCVLSGHVLKAEDMLEEYGLGIDDMRWYLARRQAERLLEYQDQPQQLAELIASGRLEADLYRMEERYLKELDEKIATGRFDEAELRRILAEVAAEVLATAKDRRR